MKGIGGNIKADFQVFKSTTNEIGEAVKAWKTIQSIIGFLDTIYNQMKTEMLNSPTV